jgi:hypothetical protein
MGAVTSVLLRLSQIDLHDQTSPTLVFVSGATRPVTAAFFATVLALLISSRVLDLHLGPSPSQGSDQLLLPISFLCGFSERFASDILSRLGGDARAADLAAARSSIRRPRPGTA